MYNTIEQKLSAIKAINEQKDKLDNILQRISLNPDKAIQITVDGQVISDLFPVMMVHIQPGIILLLESKREDLISQATELMK
jgi:hypothetical protein